MPGGGSIQSIRDTALTPSPSSFHLAPPAPLSPPAPPPPRVSASAISSSSSCLDGRAAALGTTTCEDSTRSEPPPPQHHHPHPHNHPRHHHHATFFSPLSFSHSYPPLLNAPPCPQTHRRKHNKNKLDQQSKTVERGGESNRRVVLGAEAHDGLARVHVEPEPLHHDLSQPGLGHPRAVSGPDIA
eukprot:3941823-Rhodomonas_salina.2